MPTTGEGGREDRFLLNDDRFCVGPDVRMHLWFVKVAAQSTTGTMYATFCVFFIELIEAIDQNAKAALAAAALKEIAYLKQFGQPLLPFQRERRESYEHKPQLPSDHIKNLERYLLIAPLLITKNSAFHDFRIHHPDLQPSNIIVSRLPDSHQLNVVGLIDWQQASILPLVLLAGIPQPLQNSDEAVSQALIPPSLPANVNELTNARSSSRRISTTAVSSTFTTSRTRRSTTSSITLRSDLVSMLLYRPFYQAGAPWEVATYALKTTLIEIAETWGKLMGKRCAVSSRIGTRGLAQDEGAERKGYK
ncbi:hypothetical protein B0H34DRAFT_794319 [Crassisporium funariophilum]|nr:hypothetical protein B0H34DRAFT_794319 [Crassisporium funariophilum]